MMETKEYSFNGNIQSVEGLLVFHPLTYLPFCSMPVCMSLLQYNLQCLLSVLGLINY